jgi:hypothetical protein
MFVFKIKHVIIYEIDSINFGKTIYKLQEWNSANIRVSNPFLHLKIWVEAPFKYY